MSRAVPQPKIRLEEINPVMLLAEAFEEKRAEECLDLVAGIYVYLIHQKPSASLKRKWAESMRARCTDTQITGCDFDIKTLRRRGKPTGMYYITARSHTKQCMKQRMGRAIVCEAFLNYSNTALCLGIDGRRDVIARRAEQLGAGSIHQRVRRRKTRAR